MECIFCKIINGEIPAHKIYEDDQTIAFLDILPVSEGHTLVVPKAHSESILSADHQDAAAVVATIQKIAPGLMKGVGAAAMNIGVNCGEAAGQVVFHTHVHLMPRRSGEPRTFEHTRAGQAELAATAEQIRAVL